MQFILQKEADFDIDVRILKDELEKQRYTHSYIIASLHEFKSSLRDLARTAVARSATTTLRSPAHPAERHQMEVSRNHLMKSFPCGDKTVPDMVPVGSIEFVQAFLSEVHGINAMYPIEVPKILRRPEFLKRKYSIVPETGLPDAGRYFLKYVSKLKEFSFLGSVESLRGDGWTPAAGLWQVSEAVDILAEYRCFIHDDKLIAVNFYDGDCTVFPDADTIKKMILLYSLDSARPRAYTMDIAVVRDRGVALVEIHPWVSVGLYGYLFGSDLPYCYRDGLEYYRNPVKNRPVEETDRR